MARFRTATHHNMMLDPAILCSSSRLVLIALVDVEQLRRFLIIEYYTIGAKVGTHLSMDKRADRQMQPVSSRIPC